MHATIHGHFYQPPRENPWTGLVPRQPSAAPAHDWNARVADECYRPNARSRVMGEGNRIEEIVNNYAFMDFDFGPTLLTYLERNAPDVYRGILEGDRVSLRLQNGHGNAIAQVYNHMIMPLANYRDKRTQIAWGLRDFEWRFGRKSESIWLAETAINLATVKLLIEAGIRYIVLSPFQALRCRPLERAGNWTEAAGGGIEPRRPYRYFLKDSRRRRVADQYIDVFFYDAPLAAAVSFQHLLRCAPEFTRRLEEAAGGSGTDGYVNVATDGEVYGHHEPFGDMCFSYLIRREARPRGMQFINYGHYLDLHPPDQEVDLSFGENDEGTAWSCAHGVGRWERDCGCSTGGQAGWNQKWRTPLRRGFDMVRDRLVEIYLAETSPLVRDPWAARDDYVLVLLDPGPAARESFLDQHARRPLSAAERVTLWSLLESQRLAMFMYTSCGWFFADISGIETVQNMAYACRAIELASRWSTLPLEEMLLEYLGEAWSNFPELGNGADIYRRSVRSQRVTPRMVAGDLALAAGVQGCEPARSESRHDAATERFQRIERQRNEGEAEISYHGRIALTDRATEEREVFAVHVFQAGVAGIRCYVLPAGPEGEDAAAGAPAAEEEVLALPDTVRFGLADLVTEHRERIILTAYESILGRQDRALAEFFGESRELMLTFRGAGVRVPPIFKAVASHVLGRRLEALGERLKASFMRALQYPRHEGETETGELLSEISDVLGFARESEVELGLRPLEQAFGIVLSRLLEDLLREPDPGVAAQFLEVIRRSYDLHFPLDRRPLEDVAFLVLRKHRDFLLSLKHAHQSMGDGNRSWQAFEDLAEALHLNIHWILVMGEGEEAAAGGRP
jgi:alpha-amylase/alpha-mannosidase (GH57 family)